MLLACSSIQGYILIPKSLFFNRCICSVLPQSIEFYCNFYSYTLAYTLIKFMYKDLYLFKFHTATKTEKQNKTKRRKKWQENKMFEGGVVSATGYYDHTTFCEMRTANNSVQLLLSPEAN